MKPSGYAQNFGRSSCFNIQVKKFFKFYGARLKNIYKHITTFSNTVGHTNYFVRQERRMVISLRAVERVENMSRTSSEDYEAGRLFETPELLEFLILLIYATEGCNVDGDVRQENSWCSCIW